MSDIESTISRDVSAIIFSGSFAPFSPKVKTRADEKFFYVESDGLPAHNMMVGITAWQQQVPLPQPYSGDNSWRFPLAPVPAAQLTGVGGRDDAGLAVHLDLEQEAA